MTKSMVKIPYGLSEHEMPRKWEYFYLLLFMRADGNQKAVTTMMRDQPWS